MATASLANDKCRQGELAASKCIAWRRRSSVVRQQQHRPIEAVAEAILVGAASAFDWLRPSIVAGEFIDSWRRPATKPDAGMRTVARRVSIHIIDHNETLSFY